MILISPMVTEKSMTKVAEGVYVFKVDRRARKPQIAQAIEDLYNVKVAKVNVICLKPENILVRGRFRGQKKGWKKAIISLKKGQKIPGFEEK